MVAFPGMGDEMTMSLGPTSRSPVRAPDRAENQVNGRGRFGWRSFFAIWTAISAVWLIAVAYDLYQRVSEQADMSRDVERDLDQGMVSVNCSGADCSAPADTSLENRFDIAGTYLRFGSVEMTECVFGPPIALLIVGSGVMIVLRRRRARRA